MKILIFLIFLIPLIASDEYLDEIQKKCYRSKHLITCAKYKFFKYLNIHNLDQANFSAFNYVKLVNISNPVEVIPSDQARQLPQDNELTKMFKFFHRMTDNFLNSKGLSINIPEGARILDEDELTGGTRGKKKKALLIPLLVLFKLFKINVLVGLALLGILFIKKTILVAALVLPSVILSIKNHCKMQHHPQVIPYHVEEGHYDQDPSTGYAYTGYDNKGWDRSKRHSFGSPYFRG